MVKFIEVYYYYLIFKTISLQTFVQFSSVILMDNKVTAAGQERVALERYAMQMEHVQFVLLQNLYRMLDVPLRIQSVLAALNVFVIQIQMHHRAAHGHQKYTQYAPAIARHSRIMVDRAFVVLLLLEEQTPCAQVSYRAAKIIILSPLLFPQLQLLHAR